MGRRRTGRVVRRSGALVVAVLLALIPFGFVPASAEEPGPPWVGADETGAEVIELYFVFSSTCPHCHAAIPFVISMQEESDWLRVWWLQADSGDPQVAEIANAVAAEVGEPIRAVPTFMFCNSMTTGWESDETSGSELRDALEACRDGYFASSDQPTTTTMVSEEAVDVPGLGEVKASAVPLPVFTAIVAGLDAFNPCAFFVLLFLLSLLVHARSRVRMATVGFTFIAVSGVLYFVFMAAWLNLFLVTENLRAVTLAAGLVALALGALSAKDFFGPEIGPSVSIPDAAKPGLFARMRGLISIDRLAPVLAATIALAVVANSYELLCTAGLPMVFTRVLTMSDLPTPTYYAYLALYNVIYVIPLFAIVIGFVWTLGSRKLQPSEGRMLKLLSGTMMLGLGAVLVFAPHLLERVGIAVSIVLGAVLLTVVVASIDRFVRRAPPVPGS